MNSTNTESSAPSAATPIGSASIPEKSTLPRKIPVEPDRVESADAEFEFYHQWSLEQRKQTMAFTHDVLSKLTTLAGVLLGGSISLLTGKVNPWCQGFSSLMFLAALVAGLLGVLPYDVATPINLPMVFRQAQEKALRYKTRLLYGSAIALGIGFVIALLGLIIQLCSAR